MLDVFIDADGCPVKDDVYRVAHRHGLKVYAVANIAVRVPAGPLFESVVVKGGLNAADDWIAETIAAGDIAITADIPLADRCLAKGARVLGPTGREFTEKMIGGALATRELMQGLRQTGTVTGGPAPFGKEDRSRFLSAFHEMIVQLQRERDRLAKPHGTSGETP